MMTLSGVVLMVLGVVIAPLPGPFGVPVMLLGLILLLRSSTWVKRQFMRQVHAHPKLLRPLRAMLRPGAKVVAMMWLHTLRIERRLLPQNRRFMYRFRHELKTILAGRRKARPRPGHSSGKLLSY
ncbi:hypothetical protein [Asticcacaulis sp. 201]|uniref:hypothetical protein n=1 Tax=Asticcacaulis sp. 201 TaxID=3028787 RepID=UPI002915FD6E|nr:hypothetical protein [Asticcacaulis sp. 201]MDV6329796.1 hypothetical protein [Asticcacaulis sp. 201]